MIKKLISTINEGFEEARNPKKAVSNSIFNIRNAISNLDLLKEINSLRFYVEQQSTVIKESIRSYINSQRDFLDNVRENIKRNPEELINNIQQLQKTFDTIVNVGRLGGEEMEQESERVKNELIMEFREFTPKVIKAVQTKSLKFAAQDVEEIVKKMQEAKNLERIFEKFSDFKHEFDSLREVNQKNMRILHEQVDHAVAAI